MALDLLRIYEQVFVLYKASQERISGRIVLVLGNQGVSYRKHIFLLLVILMTLAGNACLGTSQPETTHTPLGIETVQPTEATVVPSTEPTASRLIPVATSLNPVWTTTITQSGLSIQATSTPEKIGPDFTAATLRIPEVNTIYRLNVEIDYSKHWLHVDQQITYQNNTQDELGAILLIVEPRRYAGAFSLLGMWWQDGARVHHYNWNEHSLNLPLLEPLAPGESIKFSLSYELSLPYTPGLPEIRPRPFGYTDLQANLSDWYAFIPPYNSENLWVAHEPSFYGEYLVYPIADFEVDIRFTGDQTDLVIAASSPDLGLGNTHRYRLGAARNFAWSVSPHYQVRSQTISSNIQNKITLSSYYFPAYEDAGKAVLETMVKAVSLYAQLYGVGDPRASLAAVQADFLDGMEYDGLFYLSKDFYNWHNGTHESFLVSLTAHETAHTWWYGLVGNDQALEPWLDEALCTYNEKLFYENFYPQALDWWWTWRVDHYQPEGWVDISVYDVPAVYGKYRDYRDPVYLNGARFLEALREHVGDDVFYGFLHTYLIENAYNQASSQDFFDALSMYYNGDLSALLSAYFSKQPYQTP